MKKLLLLVGLVVFLTPSLVLSKTNKLKSMNDYLFCKKTTKITNEGTGVWKNIIISSVNYTKKRVVKEAKKRKLSLTECLKISRKLKILEQKKKEIELRAVVKPSVAEKGKKLLYCTESDSGRIIDTLGTKLLSLETLETMGIDGKEPQCLPGYTQVTKQEYDAQQKLMEQGLWKPDDCIEEYMKNTRMCKNYYNEMARALGCNPKKKERVKDCVNLQLASLFQVPISYVEQGGYDPKDVTQAIEEMNRANSQSNEPSQQEQAQEGQGGVYVEQGGEWVWVDLRYEKYVDRSGRWHDLDPAQKSYVTGYKIRTGYSTPAAFEPSRVSLPTGTIWGPFGQFLGFKTPTSSGYYIKK